MFCLEQFPPAGNHDPDHLCNRSDTPISAERPTLATTGSSHEDSLVAFFLYQKTGKLCRSFLFQFYFYNKLLPVISSGCGKPMTFKIVGATSDKIPAG